MNSTSTTTTVTSGGTVVTINRDQLGGGWTTQQEVDTYNTNGSLASTVVSDLSSNGSASSVTSTTMTYTSSGSVRSVTTEVDGIAADSTTSVDQIVVSGGTQVETVTDSVGTTVTSLVTTSTTSTTNSVTRTTTSDLADGTTLDLTSVAQTLTTSSGSSITSQTDTSSNGTLLDEVVTTNTPQSSGGVVTTVVSSERDGHGNFIEVSSNTNSISNAGATATTTVVDDSANGTLRSESITTRTVGSAAGSATIYGNGDGAVTQSRTVTVSSGTTTDTVENLNGDGSLVNETVTVTASGGLSKTIYVDATGSGTASAPVFDHITTDVTVMSGGSTTETVTDYGAAVSASDEIDRTQKVVSGNGLTTIVSSAFTSASLSSGTWDEVTTDQITVTSGGSVTELVTTKDGYGNVLETISKTTSADRQTVNTTTTLGTTGLVTTSETMQILSNGTVVDTIIHLDSAGDVTGATVTSRTADGLTRIVQNDIQGQLHSAYVSGGLVFDRITSDTTVINSDGSRTETINVKSQNGTLLSTTGVVTSPNGLSISATANPYATADYATKTTNLTTYNVDGSTTQTVADYNYSGSLIDQTSTTITADGLLKTVLHDYNGDGVTDQSTTDVTTINADGSHTEVVTDYTGSTSGTIRDVTTTSSGIIVAGQGQETIITRQSNGSVPTYQVEAILPGANGTLYDTTSYYASAGGPLLWLTTVATSANGLVKTISTSVNGDTSTDFYTTSSTVLNANGGQTETVANYNSAGLISETVTTTSANGLSKITEIDANGVLSGSTPLFNRVATDNTVLNSDGSRTETVTTSNTSGSTIEQTVTSTSADQQTVTISRYLDETGVISAVNQTEIIQTGTNGSVTDTMVTSGGSSFLGTIIKSTSGNGLVKSTTYKNASGTIVDSQSDTTTYDSNGDGGTTETFLDSDTLVSGSTFTTSRTTQTTGNAQNETTTLALSGALASTIAANFSVVTSGGFVIADAGVTTETTTDKINGSSTPNDTTTVVTTANQRSTTTSTTLSSASSAFIVDSASVALDGSKTDVTTYYNPASLSTIVEQTTVSKSYDGRTVTTTKQFDYDQLNQSVVNDAVNDLNDGATDTSTFSGPTYNTETDTQVTNADNSVTATRTDTGSFGAPAFRQYVSATTNADASHTTTILNYIGTCTLTGQIVADTSPNGLIKSFAEDTTGQETLANLGAAAADLMSGTTLPALLPTDIVELDTTTLNSDGSSTETIATGFGNLANLRSELVTLTSANGLVVTTSSDSNGNGIYNQVDTTTTAPDGSKTAVCNYYSDTTPTQLINSLPVGATLIGTNTYTISANGLLTTLITSTGITDTTLDFANSDGSYEWSRNVTSGSEAYTYAGDRSGSASHFIDANGIDTWSYNDGYGDVGSITIDLATENRDIAIANEIFQTLLGHPMDDAEAQYCAQYINSSGVFNAEQQAYDIVASTIEYTANFEVQLKDHSSTTTIFQGFGVLAAFENALGRLPTAEEMGTFDSYLTVASSKGQANNPDDLATMAVALAQYATDQGAVNNRTTTDPNANLQPPAAIPPAWINPGNSAVQIGTTSAYNYSDDFITDVNSSTMSGVTASIVGNNNVIVAFGGSILTISGYNNSVDDLGGPATISASNAAIMIEDGSIGTVFGSNDQIDQTGPTQLTLSSGTGDVIYVAAAALVSGIYDSGGGLIANTSYSSPYAITNASNASIMLGSSAGTVANPDRVNGNDDIVNAGANSWLTLSGTNDAVVISAGATVDLASGSTVSGSTVSSGGTLHVLSGAAASGTILAGGLEVLYSGGVASGGVVSNGGEEYVAAGATALSASISNGGQQLVYGTATSTTVDSGGQEYALSGGTISVTVVSVGGVAVVESGGTGIAATVGSGGTLNVLSGGTVRSDTVNGQQTVYGAASGTIVDSGGEELVAMGATASGTTVNSGGLQLDSGTVNGTTVSNGGDAYVFAGGTGSGAKVASGGIYVVYGTASGTAVSGGTEYVYSTGIEIGTVISSGGLQVLFASANGATVSAGGEQYVASGGLASGTILNNGASDVVFGTDSATRVGSGATEYVFGITASATASSGGVEIVESSGGAANGTALSGGTQYVYGSATGTTATSGSEIVVELAGSMSGANLGSGAIEVIYGTDRATTVSGGATQYDYASASGDTVLSGGVGIIEVGGSTSGSVISGTQYVYGSAGNDTVQSGGLIVVENGAGVSGLHVDSGGVAYVGSGGIAAGAIISGGTLEIASGGSTGGGAVTFSTSAGGTLQLDASMSFGGLVAGFGKPEALDLRDISYISGTTSETFAEAGSNLSGTLTVSDGTHVANITLLGQYVAGQFNLVSDGAGGTLVTDPPLTVATSQQTFLTRPQHG